MGTYCLKGNEWHVDGRGSNFIAVLSSTHLERRRMGGFIRYYVAVDVLTV